MDPKTIAHYDENSIKIAERHSTTIPHDLYPLVQSYFHKGASTLDLGCGMGRDTKWLNNNGYEATGVDGSEGMLNEARKRYPDLQFDLNRLPDLDGVKTQYDNIYCCAVLMHVPRSQLLKAITRILEVTKVNGRIIISHRGPIQEDERLFETYHPGQLALLFEGLGGKVLYTDTRDPWHTMVIEKRDLNQREGIAQIQDIIQRDKKTATYKFALLRALCEIARYEPNTVVWNRDADEVYVPLRRIAVRWLGYYLPLVKNEIKQTTNSKLAFEDLLLSRPEKAVDAPLLVLEASKSRQDKELEKLIRKVKHTIKVGPVTYSGLGESKIFNYVSQLDASVYKELQSEKDDFVVVPIGIWRDLNLFSHWIEDSLIVQWAELSAKLNKDPHISKHFDLLTKSIQGSERTTNAIRKLFKNQTVFCTWSGKKLNDFAVDHMIPWSVWRNNDLWNLLPSDSKLNIKKSDLLPHPVLVQKQYERIQECWSLYEQTYPELFQEQLQAALGERNLESLLQAITRVGVLHGGQFWNPKQKT